jgi:hypothetical protein
VERLQTLRLAGPSSLSHTPGSQYYPCFSHCSKVGQSVPISEWKHVSLMALESLTQISGLIHGSCIFHPTTLHFPNYPLGKMDFSVNKEADWPKGWALSQYHKVVKGGGDHKREAVAAGEHTAPRSFSAPDKQLKWGRHRVQLNRSFCRVLRGLGQAGTGMEGGAKVRANPCA